MRQGLCGQSAQLCITVDFVARFEVLATPKDGTGYVANPPTCGPLLALSPALKRWGAPIRQGLSSQAAQLWVAANFLPRSKMLGSPHAAGVM